MYKAQVTLLLLMICSAQVMADSSSINLALPNAGNSYGGDSIKAGNLNCSNSIGSSTNVEFGMTGIINGVDPIFGKRDPLNAPETKDFGVYARLVIPIEPPERINCNSLFQMELAVRRMEIQKLTLELERLKALSNQSSFEN